MASKAKPPAAGKLSKDARLVRDYMARAHLDVQSAARELGIDDRTMLGYSDGRPVPRYIMLALMHLADMAETAAKP
jgi:hypothetical protein